MNQLSSPFPPFFQHSSNILHRYKKETMVVGGSESMVIVSMWSSMAAWFTPIVLFGLMNLIVATIFIANNNNNRHDQKQLLADNNNNRHDQHQANNHNRHDQQQANNYNNNKQYDQGEDQVYSDSISSNRITIITSLFERAKSANLTSYIAAITAAELPTPVKKATYTSLSRLAQSIYFPTLHGTRSNGGELTQSEPERRPASKSSGAGSQLQRIKSVRFTSTDNEFNQISNSPGQLVRVPSLIERVKSFKISSPFKSGPPLTESENTDSNRTAKPDHHHATRSKSEKSSAKKAVVEIKKTRSEIMLPSDDEEEEFESRRPATAREARNSGDAGVDAKADDFITRFRQQLKLQRVESLVRYNDILQRRTSN